MDINPIITAITVAFNNPEELDCLFYSLSMQTYRVSCVVCVDNSNANYLDCNRQVVAKWSNNFNIRYFVNDTDIKGSARGFKIGITEALKTDFDFLWINDQDGNPKEDCLIKMLDAYKKVGKSGIYAPMILSIDGHYVLSNFRCNVNVFKRRKQSNYSVSDGIRNISFAATTGIMVHREVIERCGVYNDEAFFVGLEDAEYSYRVTNKGYKIYLIQDAIYYHPDLYIKYRKQSSLILNFLRKYPFFPNYLGSIEKEKATIREEFFCIGNSYINRIYCSFFPRSINYIYSFFRTLFIKLFNKKISLKKTLNLYKEGNKIAKRTIIQRQKYENKKPS